jgi:hypothetical protein
MISLGQTQERRPRVEVKGRRGKVRRGEAELRAKAGQTKPRIKGDKAISTNLDNTTEGYYYR